MHPVHQEKTKAFRIGMYAGRTFGALIFFSLLYLILGRLTPLHRLVSYPVYILAIFFSAVLLSILALIAQPKIKIARNVVH